MGNPDLRATAMGCAERESGLQVNYKKFTSYRPRKEPGKVTKHLQITNKTEGKEGG